MSRDEGRLANYLAPILEAIERIGRYTQDMADLAFLENQLVQDAGVRNLQIIGEARHNIDVHHPEFAAQQPELPLAFAHLMRKAVAHGYFKVCLEIVWKTIHHDLPALHTLVREARGALPSPR